MISETRTSALKTKSLLNNTNMGSIFLLMVLVFPCLALSHAVSFQKLLLPPSVTGPESLAFDMYGQGPYTGVSDGRILKYQGPNECFVDFAINSPNRSKANCDGTTDLSKGPTCGRPLGLGFYYRTGQLYIVDAFRGLSVKGSTSGLAAQLATGADGVPFVMLNTLDVDQPSGNVYFTDASAVYNFSQIRVAINQGDATGRLLKYDPNTKQVTVLMTGLSVPTGVAVSSGGSFVLVSEAATSRIQKYWLQGRKSNTSEILVPFSGLGKPDNIKRTLVGNYFWVAVTLTNGSIPAAIKINEDGNELQRITLIQQYNMVSEFQERLGRSYIGSAGANFVGVIDNLWFG